MLTQTELKKILQYDPLTGEFIWLVSRSGVKKGVPAGSVNNRNGYRQIKIDGKSYLAHRLVFLWMEGFFPPKEVDHINHIKDDNRYINLRKASRSQNSRNQGFYKNNTSGITGVYWYTRAKKWRAEIKIKGKYIYLGIFVSKTDAIRARSEAEIKYGFHPNHGKPPEGEKKILGFK